MFEQIIAGRKKDFLTSFSISLPHYPLTCKVTNTALFGELRSEKSVVAFGKYDLIFCYKTGGDLYDYDYDNVIITRSFCENISLIRPINLEVLTGPTEVRAYFSRPLRVSIKEGRPVNLNLLDYVKNLFSYAKWVEVYLDGEIAVEVTQAQETVRDEKPVALLPVANNEYYVTDKKRSQASIDHQDYHGFTETKTLDLVDKLDKNETSETKEASYDTVQKEAGDMSDKNKEPIEVEIKAGSRLTVDPETLVDLVMKIMSQRERGDKNTDWVDPANGQENPGCETDSTEIIEIKVPKVQSKPLTLDKMPSRPGLDKTFITNAPPQKPAGKSG